MKKNLLLWLLGLLIGTSQVLAQDRTISGVVTDADDGEPLIGVSVLIKGTSTGAVTDIDGKYSISNVPASAKTLVVSYVGYATQEIAITASNTVNVKLKAGVELEEVLVVGYSSVKKSDVTASVSEVGGETLRNIPIAGVDNLLQGKASGVQITALNGRPGGNAYIRIRGTGSLNASSEPLILVDGVQVALRDYAMINPADIADVIVLKDAAAAAIYGSRASNGVILVTTRRGTGSTMKKFNVQYNYNRGVKTKNKDNFELMNIEEKIAYERELGRGNPQILALTDAEVPEFIRKNKTDWFDVLLRKAVVETHDVSVSGAANDFNYYLSFGSYKEEGLVVNSLFERMNVRFNSDYRANKWLKVGNSVTIVSSKDEELRDRYNAQNPFVGIYTYNPYETVYEIDDDGNVVKDENGNPVWNLTHQGFNSLEGIENAPEKFKYFNVIGNAYAQVDIIEGLSVKTDMGVKHRTDRRYSYLYPGSILDGYVGNPDAPGTLIQNTTQNALVKWTNVANYNKTFKQKHNLSLLAGTELLKTDFETMGATGEGFQSKDLMQLDIAAQPTGVVGTKLQYALFSLFGEAKYNYGNKYFISGSVRRDGSTAFGESSRYGTFWGASVGWNIAREGFLANVKKIDQLKIRASVGTSGNDRIGDFLYLSTYNLGSYGDLTASFPASPANPDLKWESNFNYNVGIDFGFFNNRLTGSVEYYNKKTNDLLFPVALSYTSGFVSQTQNIGSMLNEGVEAELRVDVLRKKKANISLYGNFSYNKNEVLSIPTEEEFLPTTGRGLGLTVLKEGLPAYTYYLTRWAGVDPSNGQPLYYDKNGNVTNVFSEGDNVILEGKSLLPKWYGGFGLEADFYGVFVNADFYYSGGNYTANLIARDLLGDGSTPESIQRKEANDYWRNPGDITSLPNPAAAEYTSRTTDRWLQKADYLRLRSLRVGYSLPSSVLSKIKVSNLSVYFQGTNLFTATNFEGDPEVGMGSEESSTGSIGIPGEASLYSYPQFRGYSFGVNIGF